jgi:TPP-dependent pyruvate/acetoin dehydrogenase alpha subunit
MPVERAFKIEQISDRASAYGMPGVTVDGNDVIAVYKAVQSAAKRARDGHGPTLIEAVTYRWKGHSKSDRQLYRTREEVKEWMEKDPIERFRKLLKVSDAEFKKLQDAAKEQILEAVKFAENSPEPDVADILEGIYA